MKHVKSKKGSELLGQILLWALLIGALLVFSVPFFFMISNSFEEFSYVLPYPPRLLPTRLDFSAYKHILELEIFPTAVWNSVVNTCVTVVLSVFISTLSAYGFARIRFPGRDKLFGIYLFTLMSMPRAATSVATRISYFPLLNPLSASMRSFWGMSECMTATSPR